MARYPLPVKVRLEGFPADIAALADVLNQVEAITVLDCSQPYANRRGNPERVRLYMEVITHAAGPSTGGPGPSNGLPPTGA